jgi:hypothetical protein
MLKIACLRTSGTKEQLRDRPTTLMRITLQRMFGKEERVNLCSNPMLLLFGLGAGMGSESILALKAFTPPPFLTLF